MTLKPPYKIPPMDDLMRRPWNGLTVASTFSGCGGSCLGYRMAGYRVLWANEFMPAAQETYRANFPTTHLDCRDIKEVKPEEILEITGPIDIFDGSPPCQAFSITSQKTRMKGKSKKYTNGVEQQNERMFFEYIRLLRGLQPKVFIAENVKGLTMGSAKRLMGDEQMDMLVDQSSTILHGLMDCGYRVQYQILNSANFGVPQTRKRVIFIGVRRDLKLKPVFPKKLPWVYTVRDAIPWIESGSNNNPAERLGLGLELVKDSVIGTYLDKEWDKLTINGERSDKYFCLAKANPEKPCPTICASGGRGTTILHPYEKRKFTILELKRIFGFPDDFVFTGTFVEQWERLGNCVTPPLMASIAGNLSREVFGKL